MDIKKQLRNVPWITKEGFLDPAQFLIDSVLKQALSDDDRQFRSGLNMLGAMKVHGRLNRHFWRMKCRLRPTCK